MSERICFTPVLCVALRISMRCPPEAFYMCSGGARCWLHTVEGLGAGQAVLADISLDA